MLAAAASSPAGRRHEFAQDIRQGSQKLKSTGGKSKKMELTLQRGDLRRRELGGEPAGGGLVAVDQRLLGFLLACNSFDGNDRDIRSSNHGDTKTTKEMLLAAWCWCHAMACVPAERGGEDAYLVCLVVDALGRGLHHHHVHARARLLALLALPAAGGLGQGHRGGGE